MLACVLTRMNRRKSARGCGRSLTLVGGCGELYQLSGPQVQRMSNQAFFTKLLAEVEEDEAVVTGVRLREPYATLTGEAFRRAVAGGGGRAGHEPGWDSDKPGLAADTSLGHDLDPVGDLGRGQGLTVTKVRKRSIWYPGWDSNPHCRWFEHRLSAVGVPGPAGGACWIRRNRGELAQVERAEEPGGTRARRSPSNLAGTAP